MDLSKFSDADLEALQAGDVSRMSDAGLRTLSRSKETPSFQQGRESSLRGLWSVLQGPTLGFADEIGGALGGVKSMATGGKFGEGYAETRDFMRGAAQQEQEDSPIATGVTRAMAGAPLLALKLPALFQGGSLLARAGNAAATGAGFGAASGLGESTADTLGGMAVDAGKNAALGAATSGAAVPLMAGIGAVGRNAATRVSDTAAANYARQKIAEAFARDARGTVAQGDPMAALGQAQARLAKLGPEARAVDAGGQSTRQLLDTMATLPGRTKEAAETAIRSRQAGRADRLIGAAESGLNPSGLRLQDTLDDLIQRRSEKAEPLYRKLYASTVRADDDLREIVAAADQLGAGATARKIATARQLPFTLAEDGRRGQFAMRDLDHLKQGLDDIIQANIDATGKMNKTGAAVVELKGNLTAKLDELTGGAYKKARDAFAGPSALMDAAKEGRRVWSQDDQAIAKTLRNLSEGEQDAFRLGAFEALRAKLGNQAGQTEILRMWRDKTTADKLRALFADERAFRAFAADTAKETRLRGLESVGRGSQTAARQYDAGGLDIPAITDVVGAATAATHGNIPGFLAGAANTWNRVKTPEPVRNQIGSMLLAPRAQSPLPDIEEMMRQVMASQQQQAGLLGIGGGGLLTPGLLR